MSSVTVNMVLTGVNKGKSGVYGKYKFLNGVCPLTGDAVNIQHAIKYLGRTYQAYPEGSDELKKAQELYEKKETDDGSSDEATKDAGSGGTEQVQGQDGQTGQETPELRDNGSEQPDPASEAGTVDAESANGNGSESTGPDALKADNPKLVSALKKLDADNDDHWRTDGKPMLDAIQSLYGAGDITRDDVEEAWPGLNRKAMKQVQDSEESDNAEDVV